MADHRLAGAAASTNDYVRLDAAKELAEAGPDALPLLETLVTDRNDFVRQEAKASVYALARTHGDLDAARLGMRVAGDDNLHLRLSAWRGLKALPRDLIARAYRPPDPVPGHAPDCLDRALVPTADGPLRCHVCVAFVLTPGYEHLLDMCLTSLARNGGLEGLDHTVVAFVPGADDACREVCRRHGAVCVEPLPLIPPHASLKGILYSLHRWVDARCYLALEPDMLVLGSLRGIVEQALDGPPGAYYAVPTFDALRERNKAVRERNKAIRERGAWEPDLQGWVDAIFAGDGTDLAFLLGERVPRIGMFCNAGLFLGDAAAFRRVEEAMLSLRPFAALWIDTGHIYWRDELVWNLAYGLAGNLVPLPKPYNHEPGCQGEALFYDADADEHLPVALPRPPRVVHFIGALKEKMPLYMRAYGIE